MSCFLDFSCTLISCFPGFVVCWTEGSSFSFYLLAWRQKYLHLSDLLGILGLSQTCSRDVPTPHFLSFFSSVQSLSRVWLFATPWNAACQASLSITNSRSPPKPISIESVMPSNHLILCCPFLLLPSVFPSIRVFFKWVSSSHQVAKVLAFQLQHQSFQWTPRTDFL